MPNGNSPLGTGDMAPQGYSMGDIFHQLAAAQNPMLFGKQGMMPDAHMLVKMLAGSNFNMQTDGFGMSVGADPEAQGANMDRALMQQIWQGLSNRKVPPRTPQLLTNKSPESDPGIGSAMHGLPTGMAPPGRQNAMSGALRNLLDIRSLRL